MIPPFRPDGYLPEGVHVATEAEMTFRFGSTGRQRRRLVIRLRRWIALARLTGAQRFLVDGSFVTSKPEPGGVDAVVLLSEEFHRQVRSGTDAAIELEQMFLTRQPEEIFAAEDDHDWQEWVEFFSRTREIDRRRKGLVEVQL